LATITVSEELASRIFATAVNQGVDAEELLLSLLDSAEDAAIMETPLSEEDIAAVHQGLADVEAGRTISLDEARIRLEARFGK
jgi:hypothetical protein